MADLSTGIPSFFWGNDPNVNLQLRQRIAMQMLSQKKSYPKTFGEGLGAIGDALGDVGIMRRLEADDRSAQTQANASVTGAMPDRVSAAEPEEATRSVAAAPTTAETPPQATADVSGFRPAPSYLQPALDRLVADPARRAYLGHLASREAQSPTEVSPTGAAGPFQFIRSTGQQYGLVGDGKDTRTDVDASVLAANRLTDDNAKVLTERLGREPTPGELALAHQQGAVTAANMLTGAGNAPARNLAVNNVAPTSSPAAAANKIMGYYGMPGPRDKVATVLASNAPMAYAPSTGNVAPPQAGTPPGAASTPPPQQAAPNVAPPAAPAIAPAPVIAAAPQEPQIKAAPPAPDPGYVMPEPQRPQAAPLTPYTPVERRGMAEIAKYPGNPYVAQRWAPILAEEKAKRDYQDSINKKVFDTDVTSRPEFVRMRQEQIATQAKRVQDYAKVQQDIQQQAITPQPPPSPVTGTDPRLGTPQSPQRTGVPTAPPVPPGITPKEHAEKYAPILTSAVEAEEKARNDFRTSLGLIQKLREHPGREWGLGPTGTVARQIPGTDALAFDALLKQAQGKLFLQAYQSLKGGGSITEIEGAKAEQAVARLNAAQKPKDFDAALNDLDKIMRSDMETAQRKVNRPVTAWRAWNDNSSTAPDIGQRRGSNEYIGGDPSDPMSWRKIQ
jgi:hypothetical protein